MKKINLLSKAVYNRIAAGEVVDRPYSAVKELVENSIDAKATEIEIYIEGGGKQYIRVVDNGTGIEKDDLPAAFMPHATSKISCVDDLDAITTLGFRGEALASIAAISKVEIISAVEGEQGYKITCEGGETGEIMPAATHKGTQITVKDLFYNTPARAKFMKPDKKEEADITSFITRFVLGNPKIRFKYYVDGKLTIQSLGGGLEEAVAQVYGAKTVSQCFKLDADKDGLHVYGFIGNQNFFKPNKSYQSLFLNGRYIVNNTIATAISNAYASYAMKRQFPFYVLNVDMPSDIVDVNVHPNKADVRFIDNHLVFGVIYKIISSVLDGNASAAEFVISSTRIPEVKSTVPKETQPSNVDVKEIPRELIDKYKPQNANGKFDENFEPTPVVKPKEERDSDMNFFNPEFDMPLTEYYRTKVEMIDLGSSPTKDPMRVADAALQAKSLARAKEIEERYAAGMQERMLYDTFKFCGTIFNTYLIYERRDDIYFIDQHAAHERIIYDDLTENIKRRRVMRQPMLFPYILDLNPEETVFIQKNTEVLEEIGFTLEYFGTNVYKITEVPSDLQEINVREFFDDILSEMQSYRDIKLEEVLKDRLAMTACKHAIKGGMRLTEQEIDRLFKMMEGNVGLKCPHGRPVCVKLSKREIEKMFKRIV